VITVTVPSQINAGRIIKVNSDGFVTPGSSAETSTFKFTTLRADGTTVIDDKTSGITITVSPVPLQSNFEFPIELFKGASID